MNKISKVALAWLKKNNFSADTFLNFKPNEKSQDLYFTLLVERLAPFPKIKFFFNDNEWIFQYDDVNLSYEEIPYEHRKGNEPIAVIYVKNHLLSETIINNINEGHYQFGDIVDLPGEQSFIAELGELISVENQKTGHLELYAFA